MRANFGGITNDVFFELSNGELFRTVFGQDQLVHFDGYFLALYLVLNLAADVIKH